MPHGGRQGFRTGQGTAMNSLPTRCQSEMLQPDCGTNGFGSVSKKTFPMTTLLKELLRPKTGNPGKITSRIAKK